MPFPGKQDDIFFVDAETGWYGNGKGFVYKTTDGGETWNQVWHRDGTFVRALGFVDRQTGFAGNIGPNYFPGVKDPRPLYRTDDGGKTWRPVKAVDGGKIVGVCAIDVLQAEFEAGHRVVVLEKGRRLDDEDLLRARRDPRAYLW